MTNGSAMGRKYQLNEGKHLISEWNEWSLQAEKYILGKYGRTHTGQRHWNQERCNNLETWKNPKRHVWRAARLPDYHDVLQRLVAVFTKWKNIVLEGDITKHCFCISKSWYTSREFHGAKAKCFQMVCSIDLAMRSLGWTQQSVHRQTDLSVIQSPDACQCLRVSMACTPCLADIVSVLLFIPIIRGV